MMSTKDLIVHPAYAKNVLNTLEEDIERMGAVVSVQDLWQEVTNRVGGVHSFS